MKTRILAAAALTAALATGAAAQQDEGRLAAGVRLMAAIPTGDEFSREASVGLGAGADVRYRFFRNVSAYVGYSALRFDIDQVDGLPIAEGDLTLTGRGYDAGLMARWPTRSAVSPWVRGGVLAHFLKYGGDAIGRNPDLGDGEVDEGFGFEVGLGLDVRVGKLDVAPGMSFRHLPFTDITGSEANFSVIAFSLGLRIPL
jgi:hypothetical protein